MDRTIIVDRIPESFCEGPFWGNGTMGAVMYIQDKKLCISIDHAQLWELRETLPDEPKATFTEILNHKEEYLKGDSRMVENTNIFDEHIGRTRLPALAIELDLGGEITGFCAETDLGTATTKLNLVIDGGAVEGTIWLDSCKNVLCAKLSGGKKKLLSVKALGWNLELPALKPLKNWGYEPCTLRSEGNRFSIWQTYSGDQVAVLNGEIRQQGETFTFAVGICAGNQEELPALDQTGARLIEEYLEHRQQNWEVHCQDWKAYWQGFGITVPNERLQEAFDQEMYKLYCNERPGAMPITLQGVWNPNNRMPAWFGDLHNDLNVQSCYWPAYMTGNVELVRPYIEYYAKAADRFMIRAKKLFGLAGAIHVPTMMAPDGSGAASEWCYWNTILGPELFVAVDFCWFYEYSRDVKTLKEQIYPFLEGVLRLYEGIAYLGADGQYHIPFTQSPEVDRDGHMLMADDAVFTISTLHYLCGKMAVYGDVLKTDASHWTVFGDQLVSAAQDKSGFMLFPEIPVFGSHRHFCQLYPIYPLCQEAHNEVANASLDTAINQGFLEFAAFSFPYLAIMASRCGRGNMARTMLEIYCMVFRSRNSFTVNGDPYQNGVLRISETNAGERADSFTLESGFFIPAALCQMFVHRAGNEVWLLKGIPDEWKACSCHGITIEGGHKFDITMTNYQIQEAVIHVGCDEDLILHLGADRTVKQAMKQGELLYF